MSSNKKARATANGRQLQFAALAASGTPNSVAYRAVYNPGLTAKTAAERGCRLAKHPAVMAEVARLREKQDRKKLLSLNDRLNILADISQDPKSKPHEKARAIEVYSRISGDQAPERHEVSAPGGGPVAVAVTAAVSVTHLSVRERIAKLKGARAAREHADREASAEGGA